MPVLRPSARRPAPLASPASALLAMLAIMAVAIFQTPPARAASNLAGFVTMYSDRGDSIGVGEPRLFYSPGNAAISLSGDGSYLIVSVNGGTLGDYFSMNFAAPIGQTLHGGVYLGAERAAFRTADHPGMDIYGNGSGCNEVGGRFDVKDIQIGATGSIKALWLTYEQHCERGVPALFGEIRIGGDAPSGFYLASGELWWPDTTLGTSGTTVPVWAINGGAGSARVSSVALTGLHASDFAIRSDGCVGQTLQIGRICQVLLQFVPTVAGPRTASLTLKQGNGVSSGSSLDGAGIDGTTHLLLHSDTGDWVGQGGDYSYDPSNAQFAIRGAPSAVRWSVDGNDGNWVNAFFSAPSGEVLAAGTTYTGALRYGYNGSAPGMDVTMTGHGCNTLTGQFTITDISFDPADGSLQYVGIDFEQHCEGATPALHGSFRYRVPSGDVTPPQPVSKLSVVRGKMSATVSWSNPSDDDYSFTMVRYLIGGYPPGSPNGSLFAYAGRDSSVALEVSVKQPLAISVWAIDASGNVSQATSSVTG
jgi:hypothetical protein